MHSDAVGPQFLKLKKNIAGGVYLPVSLLNHCFTDLGYFELPGDTRCSTCFENQNYRLLFCSFSMPSKFYPAGIMNDTPLTQPF